jgi:Uma2 family endonuclease
MSTMTLDEYFHTSFDGIDPEFFDGTVVERNGGTLSHSRAMVKLGFPFWREQERAGLFAALSLRLRIARNRVRVADIAVFEREPQEEVPSTPPLVAIEILSPSDTVGYIVPKLEEYRQWGVRHIWLADPDCRKLFTYGDAGPK